MRRTTLALALSAFGTCLLLGANAASADSKGKHHDDNSLTIRLKGSEEAPVVISNASGTLDLDINEAAGSIAYELNYADLEGNVTQAHIHIGQRNVSGGIAIWLCQTAAAPAPASPPANPAVAATPQCPGPHEGTVTGTVTAANVIGPVGQAVPVGAFADVIKAIRAGKAYGNVHSTSAPGGEVRGQIDD